MGESKFQPEPDLPELAQEHLDLSARWALPCAVAPFVTGSLAFGGWLACWWYVSPAQKYFVWLGAIAIVFTMIGVTLGFGKLLYHVDTARKFAGPENRFRVLKHGLFFGLLLLINYPTLFAYFAAYLGLRDTSFLEVQNRARQAIEVIVVDIDGPHSLGNVPAGQTITTRIRPPIGSFDLVLKQEEAESKAGTLEKIKNQALDITAVYSAPEKTELSFESRPIY